MHGFGQKNYIDGKEYRGEFVQDKRSGYGELCSHNVMYYGYWIQGKQHGLGKLIVNDETEYCLWNLS